jgi:hypothetical protein
MDCRITSPLRSQRTRLPSREVVGLPKALFSRHAIGTTPALLRQRSIKLNVSESLDARGAKVDNNGNWVSGGTVLVAVEVIPAKLPLKAVRRPLSTSKRDLRAMPNRLRHQIRTSSQSFATVPYAWARESESAVTLLTAGRR